MNVQEILISQHRASLRMLLSAVEACPESLWTDDSYKNRTWHVAYHAILYTHLYLGRSPEAIVPWEKARPDYHYLGQKPLPPHEEPKIGEPYTKGEILEYGRVVSATVGPLVHALPLDGPSGFPWLPFSRMELHIYSIRHVQHHSGQIIDRIRVRSGVGIGWTGMVRGED